MRQGFYLFVALLASGISLGAEAAFTATVNKNNFASGETIQLRLQHDGNADGQPDIAPLRKDFEVLGSSSGSSVQIINGSISRSTQFTMLLSPKRDGKLQIPSLQWGGEQSAAIEVTVGGSGGSNQQGSQPATDNAHVFLTTVLDQKQPYVQAAVVLTVRLYTDQPLLQASMDFPASSDVLVKQLGKDIHTTEMRNGRNFQVIERKYLLFPQRSGKLSLNGPVLDAQVRDDSVNDPFGSLFNHAPFGGMINATRPLRVRAKPVELNVLPRPASATGANWLPAQKVTLEETWPQGIATIHVGEPLTRHLQITALGLTGAQLPDPGSLISVPEGIKAYPDQSNVAESPQGDSVLGTREQNIALIASRPGHYDLPSVRLHWWDTAHNETREVTLPARRINVLPAADGSPAVAMPNANIEPPVLLNQGAQANAAGQTGRAGGNQLWMWLSLVLGLLWLGTSVAWWRLLRLVKQAQPVKVAAEKQPPVLQAGGDFKALKRACGDNDPHAARRHLLAWAATVWPDSPPKGLNELAQWQEDARFAGQLRLLDRACYTGSAWDGEALAQSLPKSAAKAVTPEKKSSLPGLYQ